MQGSFSHSLAEYTLAACNWFAKDFPRLRAQQKARKWEPFNMEELRKRTMGVVGYGDIGQAAARIARAFGMRIIALRRNPELSDQEKQDCLTVRTAPVTTATAPAYHICMQGYHQEGFTCKACPGEEALADAFSDVLFCTAIHQHGGNLLLCYIRKANVCILTELCRCIRQTS